MPFTVTMPKLSPTMQEGTILKWHKKIGDKVEAGDLLLEVATDKATVEYNALDDGFLRKILIPENGHAIVNEPIAIFTEKANESIEGYAPVGTSPKATVEIEEKSSEKPITQPTTSVSLPVPAFLPEAPLQNYEFEFPTTSIPKRIPASPLAKKKSPKKKGLI